MRAQEGPVDASPGAAERLGAVPRVDVPADGSPAVSGPTLREFVAEDWFEIPGRGAAAVIAGIPGLDALTLLGQRVKIDGKVYSVKGVEWNLVQSVGRKFSLLVSER